MREVLNKLIQHESLSQSQAKEVLLNIAKEKYNANQISSFVTVYMMRSISIEELSGFKEALMELCIPIDLSDYKTIDLCGTGGDGKNTFNISTLASFVTAACDIKVAKHGNYGVSSVSGSSNVMEELGVKFTNNEDSLRKSIEKANICFVHAQLFNPTMKNVGSIRKELAVKTFFNMLGPMINPTRPKNQLVGVFNLELARMYTYIYQNTDVDFTIIHSLDGYDEISLTGNAKIITPEKEYVFTPSELNLEPINYQDIKGGKTTKESSEIFLNILNGKGTDSQNNVVCANAAFAISNVTKKSILESFQLAKEALLSGKAKDKFLILRDLSQKFN